jgi:MerR family transcriptional regulator, light-induced transcriptional regulator
MQLPRLSALSEAPLYNTQAVVRLTSVEAPRLRAWEKRYGILTPHRGKNGYRIYSDRDVAIIKWLHAQVSAGMTIKQATTYLRALMDEEAQAATGEHSIQSRESGLSMEMLHAELLEAACRMDEPATRHILTKALAIYSVEDICQILIHSVFIEIGELWRKQHTMVAVEHFLTQVVRAQLEALWQATHQPGAGPLVLVTCVPGEQHDLGAFILALLLRRVGRRVMFLGPNIEAESLVLNAEMLQPRVICLSVVMAEHARAALALAKALLAVPGADILLGGAGISPDAAGNLSARVRVLDTSGPAAVAAISDLVVTP